ncbi:hypothetical protein [Paenibacillus thermotolerans]|uniref:hypothetical protein n=1 Tax=Paenibacillus thermotolerans TaxID=3027807 RepID=UPI0023675F36|nr:MULTISPECIES: hypothetical protein [unclassified Paenibacillus]
MRLLYVALLACVTLTACGSAASSGASSEPKEEYKPTLDVALEIDGNDVTVTIITDLSISAEHYGHAREAGEGHIHMYLDDGPKEGVKQEKTVIKDLDPGKHKLRVSLHNNDHTPYDVSLTKQFEIE